MSTPVPIVPTMTEYDFDALCTNRHSWRDVTEWRTQQAEWGRFETTGKGAGEDPSWDWEWAYFVPKDWTAVMFVRAFLASRGHECEVVFDTANLHGEADCEYVVLTNWISDEDRKSHEDTKALVAAMARPQRFRVTYSYVGDDQEPATDTRVITAKPGNVMEAFWSETQFSPVHYKITGYATIDDSEPAGIDFSDERFVDPEFLEAHRKRELSIDQPFGHHRGVVVANYTDVNWIDERLAEAIYYTWKLGIVTTESCQDLYGNGEDKAFIGFGGIHDMEQWLQTVVPQDDIPGGMWDRATGCNVAAEAEGMWEYDMVPRIEGTEVVFRCFVEFPISDIPEITKRLREAFEQRKTNEN